MSDHTLPIRLYLDFVGNHYTLHGVGPRSQQWLSDHHLIFTPIFESYLSTHPKVLTEPTPNPPSGTTTLFHAAHHIEQALYLQFPDLTFIVVPWK